MWKHEIITDFELKYKKFETFGNNLEFKTDILHEYSKKLTSSQQFFIENIEDSYQTVTRDGFNPRTRVGCDLRGTNKDGFVDKEYNIVM